ncbi:MAG: hypothetical protein LBT50_02400 [Prevotellaceae bacterium]|jgi:hypothetical protein|nr:hypothetical protein [Prevotellaceae bacterium]
MSNIFEIINPVDKDLFGIKPEASKYLLINKVNFVERKLPDTKIAILGIGSGLISIRKAFYGMYCDYDVSISDLGNIPLFRKDKLGEILKTLSDNNIFTILIGNSVDVSSVCLDSLAGRKRVSASVVSPAVIRSDFINYLINNKFEHLFNLNVLAYQTYLSDPEILNKLSSNYFETLRLGKFREDFRIYEPALRDSDMFSLDIASVRKSEITDSSYSGPNGLYAEEICLISRYAGISDNLKIANIFCLNKIEENGQINELIAQIVWHIVDGFAHRTDENMLNNVNGIKKILVNLEHPAEQLVFYHSDLTNRWWMEVQGKSEKIPLIIACSEEDYKIACRHDVPLRWVWYQQKLANKN